jgi:hypothetical protein
MRFLTLLPLLTLFAATDVPKPARVLACNMGALTADQRARHLEVGKRLLQHAQRRELPDGFAFTIDRANVSVAEVAEWVADESRCCPAVDYAVELPASGPLTLRLYGGADVKELIASELSIR